ncbi:MAG: hypothetical protein K0R50_4452 [Eubacterium sp.]|jgi:hypothetical protein|nr:hypothetical protein [Eubacterium sp.]
MSINLYLIGLTPAQEKAVQEVTEFLDISLSQEGLPVYCRKAAAQQYSFTGDKGIVEYKEPHQFLRGLGIFIENLKLKKTFHITEKASYDDLGVMVDCSRNGVLNLTAFKKLIRHLALMGYSSVQLYTEDTYEIKGRPYFGYQRGRYTSEEFKEMDSYSHIFSIELVPCIQTLAHLGRVLNWEAFSELRDCNDILLIDDEKTYTLLEDMFRTMSENLSSRRINIGMDEAHMVGLGRYLEKHGYQDRIQVMLRHFNRVMEIARKYGYHPMMWSDMFFRLVSGGEYIAEDCPIREDLLSQIPEDITLVYWNYYSTDSETYDKMFKNHKKMSPNIAFAGGAWKWSGFCPSSRFSEAVAKVAHGSCVRENIREVLITAWGDDGAECPLFAVLPAFQLWAELCYADRCDEEYLESRFSTCVRGSYRDFLVLGDAVLTPDNPAPGRCGINPSKYLLYQDVLGGLFDAHVMPDAYSQHYHSLTARLKECGTRNQEWAYLFESQTAFSCSLELKCDLGLRLRKAYHSGDINAIRSIAETELPELLVRLERLLAAVENQWKYENKIFGLEVLELRLGGLKQRLVSAGRRLRSFTYGEIDKLEELEADVLSFDGKSSQNGENTVWAPVWHNIVSPAVVVTV